MQIGMQGRTGRIKTLSELNGNWGGTVKMPRYRARAAAPLPAPQGWPSARRRAARPFRNAM
eukprot:5463764-Pyramimonas_sp.AAC.1